MMLVKLPPRFWHDHFGRGLPSGEFVRETSRHVLVELDAEALRELRSDAAFYVEMGVSEFGAEFAGLVASARATLRALDAVELS